MASPSVAEKYAEERAKRFRGDGMAQYVDTTRSEQFKHFATDPWAARTPNNSAPIADGHRVKVLIIGTGFVSLVWAHHLIKSGFKPEDLLFVDKAADFGGVWYWNRYPGLMCDVESYIYMPLLEETGYMPKHKYSYGQELREYAKILATQLGIADKALFRVTSKTAIWDEDNSQWTTTVERENGEAVRIVSTYVIMANGVLSHPKLPLVPGIEGYKGHCFHTSRWDYNYTGGSQEDPQLVNLKDKRVAIVGTGATAIQAVPALADWVKELYVVQRTPSAVDVRGQRPTNAEEFKTKIATHEGWQQERTENFAAWGSNVPDRSTDLVQDGWTAFPSFSALLGGPGNANVGMENLHDHIEKANALDLPRQERVRQRVVDTVKDEATAASLQPWYAGFCKRPCFHDEYLEAFNKTNVHLVDTKGKGISKFGTNSFFVGDEELDVDLVIYSTGFEPWTVGSPASRAGMNIVGVNGRTLDEKWKEEGVSTLHGVFSNGFPNLAIPGYAQAGISVNQIHMFGVLAQHASHIISQAEIRGSRIVEPTVEAEGAWAMRIMTQAYPLAVAGNCTPSYATAEGAATSAKTTEAQMRVARGASWTRGILDFSRVLKEWRETGTLEGYNFQDTTIIGIEPKSDLEALSTAPIAAVSYS